MQHRVLLLAVLAAWLSSSLAWTQEYPALLYSLPDDGVWVEYSITGSNKGSAFETTERLSCVGTKETQGGPIRIVELKYVTKPKKGEERILTYQLHINAKQFKDGKRLRDCIAIAVEKNGKDGKIELVTDQQLDSMLSETIFDREPKLKLIKKGESVETKLGKFTTRQYFAQAGSTDNAYRAWLSDEVPFGVVKARTGSTRSLYLSVKEAVRSGKDAKSELGEIKK